jgi:signal transduction histidine kinase
MMAMIGELLDIARLQADRPLDLQYSEVDLVALAHREAERHRRGTARHTLRVESPEPSLTGEWDETRLLRVLSNLLSNAIKYSPEGGEILITVRRVMEAGREWAEVTVRDPGLGIPAGELPRVFERFYRASNVTGRIGGTGIGLAGSRGIVEQHGGSLVLESIEGQGTTVTLRLPLE